MFDQPTTACFPEEAVDAADDQNADWEAVRRQFAPVRDVVDALDVQSGFIDNRRTGVTLIPSDWLAVDDH